MDEDDALMLQAKQQITNNVISKRKEQLRRWKDSEMNGEQDRRTKRPKVKFQDSDIFLSACMSGDEEEVDELLGKGADINTCTIDGLTALHQSVIDSKPEMVRFLCEKDADVNAQDNEGWTPLHAAACCGNLVIIQYLCQHGADLTVVNSDKELALDLADNDECREFLEAEYARQGIDVDACRDQELTIMMKDAQGWLSTGSYRDIPHSRTGGTAMHVAAARGYTQLLELLIKAGGDVSAKDKDGWTPLHAAAHWAERDACKILMEKGARIGDLTFSGQDVYAVADKAIEDYLKELAAEADARGERKKSPPSSYQPSVLAEKNQREYSHDEHILSSDRKRDLQHKDQHGENEVLHHITPSPTPSAPTPAKSSSSAESSQNSSRESSTAVSAASSVASVEKRPSALPENGDMRYSRESSRSQASPSSERFSPLVRSSDSPRFSSEREQSVSTVSSEAVTTVSTASSGTSRSAPPTSGTNSEGEKSPSPIGSTTAASIRSMSVPPSTATSGSGSGSGRDQKSSSESSTNSAEPSVSATIPMVPSVPPPRALNQAPSSWINRGTPLISRSSSTTASRTSSTPLSEVSSQPTPSTSATASSISAKASPASTASSTTGSVTVSATFTKPPRWQKPVQESEAERRNNSRMQRQHRRSTQGVTKEQMEEAMRLAQEDIQKRNSISVSSTSAPTSAIVRLASEERDLSNTESDRSMSRDKEGDVNTSATVSLASPMSVNNTSTNSTNNLSAVRRRSQAMPLGRSNRRGTGPVLAEDVQAAFSTVSNTTPSSLRLAAAATAPQQQQQQQQSYTMSPRLSATSATMAGSNRFNNNVPEKATSLPPSQMNNVLSGITQSAVNQRSAVVAGLSSGPSSLARVPAVSRFGTTSTASNGATINSYTRPTETNLNYKALYEKERVECEKLRKEMEDLRKSSQSDTWRSTSTAPSWRARNSSPASNSGLTVAKSSSLASFDDGERRSMERKINDLEAQVKSMSQLRLENQRLKEENGALVRVISKITI